MTTENSNLNYVSFESLRNSPQPPLSPVLQMDNDSDNDDIKDSGSDGNNGNNVDIVKHASLFPILDKLILYTPVYVFDGRQYVWMHYVLAVGLIGWYTWRTVFNCILILKDSHGPPSWVMLFATLIIGPYILEIIRLYFFYKYFNFNIWKLVDDTQKSFVLMASPVIKKEMKKSVKWIGIVLGFVMFVNYGLGYYVSFILDLGSRKMFFKDIRRFYVYLTVDNLIGYYISHIPSIIMVIVSKIYCIEGKLYVNSFKNELKQMELKDLIQSDICSRYMTMHNVIKKYRNYFYYWHVMLIFQAFICLWYTSIVIGSKNDIEYKLLVSEAILFITTSSLNVIFAGVSLWDAMLMTELFKHLISLVPFYHPIIKPVYHLPL